MTDSTWLDEALTKWEETGRSGYHAADFFRAGALAALEHAETLLRAEVRKPGPLEKYENPHARVHADLLRSEAATLRGEG